MPTANDNLLYLLIELEHAIGRPNVNWSRELAARIQHRLEDLVETVGRIGARQP